MEQNIKNIEVIKVYQGHDTDAVRVMQWQDAVAKYGARHVPSSHRPDIGEVWFVRDGENTRLHAANYDSGD